jgi:hypothetical protein
VIADFGVSDHGSIILVHPHSDLAREWIEENVSDEAQFMGDALVVERRFASALIQGMRSDGLILAQEVGQ